MSKGSNPRPTNYSQYDKNHDEIRWKSKGDEKRKRKAASAATVTTK